MVGLGVLVGTGVDMGLGVDVATGTLVGAVVGWPVGTCVGEGVIMEQSSVSPKACPRKQNSKFGSSPASAFRALPT